MILAVRFLDMECRSNVETIKPMNQPTNQIKSNQSKANQPLYSSYHWFFPRILAVMQSVAVQWPVSLATALNLGPHGGGGVSSAALEKWSRWWFQIFFIFTPIWGTFPLWLILFKGVETTNQVLKTIFGKISFETQHNFLQLERFLNWILWDAIFQRCFRFTRKSSNQASSVKYTVIPFT